VKSSDCRTTGRSPGHIRSGKWWEGSWASAELVGGTVGSWSSSGFDWALFLPESVPWSHCWGPRSAAIWLLVVDWDPWTQSYVPVRGLHPSPQPCWEFLSANPYLANWGGCRYHWVLMEFVPGQGAPVQCPPNALFWPGFPLSPSGSQAAWAKLYAVSPQSSASQPCHKSLNFHESHTLPDSLEMRIYTCTWLASCGGDTFCHSWLNC
jgi:hypothetical protein